MTSIAPRDPYPRYDPEKWAAIYGADPPDGASFVFVRGRDLVADAAARCMHRTRELAARAGDEAGSVQFWLDAGSGTGHLAERLADSRTRVVGIDRDLRMVRHAAARASRPDDTSTPGFLPAEVHALPIRDGVADGFVALSLMGCLPSPTPLLGEAFRVLRPGGWIVLTCTNRQSLVLRANGLLRRLDRLIGAQQGCDRGFRYRLYRVEEVCAALEAAGYEDPQVQFYNLFLNVGRSLLPGRSLAVRLETLLPCFARRHLARNFLVAARRPSHGAGTDRAPARESGGGV